MRTAGLLISILISTVPYGRTWCQYNAEIVDFENRNDTSGSVIVNKSAIRIEGCSTYRIFEITAPGSGEYYFRAWLMAAETENGYLPYEILVNNAKQDGRFQPEKSNWQQVEFRDKNFEPAKVKLNRGTNLISFCATAPEIPEVEMIKLDMKQSDAAISDKEYLQFVLSIRNEMAEREKNPENKKDTAEMLSISKISLPGPTRNYSLHSQVTFMYTTFKRFMFYAGQTISFSSHAYGGFEHVLEVFHAVDPEFHSWVALSDPFGLASLNISIPDTGIYCLRIRSYRQWTRGLANLQVNGQYTFRNCPVSSTGFRYVHETPVVFSYFTCRLQGDSRIWIEDNPRI
jgi:hypothetical protein